MAAGPVPYDRYLNYIQIRISFVANKKNKNKRENV